MAKKPLTTIDILKMRREGQISFAEAAQMLRDLKTQHANALADNEEKLADYYRRREANVGGVGRAFPKQKIDPAILARSKKRKADLALDFGLLTPEKRREKITERAKARAEKRRARMGNAVPAAKKATPSGGLLGGLLAGLGLAAPAAKEEPLTPAQQRAARRRARLGRRGR